MKDVGNKETKVKYDSRLNYVAIGALSMVLIECIFNKSIRFGILVTLLLILNIVVIKKY